MRKIIKNKDGHLDTGSLELKKKMIQREKTHKEKMTNLQVKLAEKVMQ